MAHGRFDNPVVAALAGVKDFLRKQDLVNKLKDTDRIDGKTCLVTGANSGLGYALAVELAKRGGDVIMAQLAHDLRFLQKNLPELIPADQILENIVARFENLQGDDPVGNRRTRLVDGTHSAPPKTSADFISSHVGHLSI